MPSLFMKRTSPSDDDKFTRDDTPRTRPRPSERVNEASTSATPAATNTNTATTRDRRRLSITSTMLGFKHPGEWRSRLPAIFNIIRFVLYGVVIVWTVVCLAIAVHFNGVLQPSELTTFVPFGLFVSVASVLIFPVLLGVSLWKREASPISARIELGCLGLAGMLWIALGAFMGSSDAEVAEVECYASENDTEPVSLPGFTTETFHAQYHVLEAFSLFNAVIIWGFLIFATILAYRHHRRGNREIWYHPVTSLPWTGQGVKDTLPDPAVQRNPKTVRTPAAEKSASKDDYFGGAVRGRSATTPYWTPGGTTPGRTPAQTPGPASGQTPRAGEDGYVLWMPHMSKNSGNQASSAVRPPPPPAAKQPAPAAKTAPRPIPNRYNSTPLHRSGTGGSSTAPLFDKFKRDASPQRHDSQRSARSQTADRWARGASPTRNDSGRRGPSREPQRQDSARSGPGRSTSRDPQRQDSSRSNPTRPPPVRSTSREPQRQDSSRSRLAQVPQRMDSSRSQPQRMDSGRGRNPQPQRQDSTRSDRWGRDASPRR